MGTPSRLGVSWHQNGAAGCSPRPRGLSGAGDGTRTRNPKLGKLMRYHCATPARPNYAIRLRFRLAAPGECSRHVARVNGSATAPRRSILAPCGGARIASASRAPATPLASPCLPLPRALLQDRALLLPEDDRLSS